MRLRTEIKGNFSLTKQRRLNVHLIHKDKVCVGLKTHKFSSRPQAISFNTVMISTSHELSERDNKPRSFMIRSKLVDHLHDK